MAGFCGSQRAPDALFTERSAGRDGAQVGTPLFVYFIQAGLDGPIKIGSAKNPGERLATHQTSNHEELRIVCTIPCPSRNLEKSLHASFARHHIRGEWYRPGPEILKIIATWSNPPASGCCPDCSAPLT